MALGYVSLQTLHCQRLEPVLLDIALDLIQEFLLVLCLQLLDPFSFSFLLSIIPLIVDDLIQSFPDLATCLVYLGA